MSRIRDRIERHHEQAHDLHTHGGTRITTGRTTSQDEQRLRYIPAIGRGAPGVIPGTKPGDRLGRRPRPTE